MVTRERKVVAFRANGKAAIMVSTTDVTINWLEVAKKRWRMKVAWIRGDGQYALLSICNKTKVSLHQTKDEAEISKKSIDMNGCGEECDPYLHKVIDLATKI